MTLNGVGRKTSSSQVKFTASEVEALSQMWLAYAKAFLRLIDTVPETELDGSVPSYKQKHGLIVSKLEIVGAPAEVIDSPNAEIVGTHGTIVEEHENSILIVDQKCRLRRVPKNVCTLRISVEDRNLVLFGPEISGIRRTGSVFRKSAADLARLSLHPLEYS
jgi:RNase P/RNase MRP subunit p29